MVSRASCLCFLPVSCSLHDGAGSFKNLEVVTLDIKDAYLNVDQKAPVVINVDASLLDDGKFGVVQFVLEKLLPGQRVAAAEWFNFIRDILHESDPEEFVKEPNLFRHVDDDNDSMLVIHANHGLLAAMAHEREELVKRVGAKVKVQVSAPMKDIGDELEFLKRKYVKAKEGILMFSGRKHVDGLIAAPRTKVVERDSPSDHAFLEADNSKELGSQEAKIVSRMRWPSSLSESYTCRHSVCNLHLVFQNGKPDKPCNEMASKSCWVPPEGSMHQLSHQAHSEFGMCWLPWQIGFLSSCKVVAESITDVDWAGCKGSRRSRSSIHLYVGGSLVASMVRSQRSISLSSGESEFIALVGGAGEIIYVKECLDFLLKESCRVEARLRSDSAACRGITQRLGCGRIRHLHAGLLWVQDCVMLE